MRTDPLPLEVREVVLRVFQDLGAEVYDVASLDEMVLLDDGRYTARTYRADGLMAMWLIGVGIVQFYDAQGSMLMTVNLLQEREPQRMAA